MNDKVDNLIKQEKERLLSLKQQMRDNHLISLGLIDESKTFRKYQNYFSESAKLDEENQKFYTESVGALDVSEEEYAEICKYFPPKFQKNEILNNPTGSEKTLNIIAIICLVCGIICTLIFLGILAFVDKYGDFGDGFNITGFMISLGVLLISLTIWSILRVFSQIASNVRQMNCQSKQL